MKKCQVCCEEKNNFVLMDRATGRLADIATAPPFIEEACLEVCTGCYEKVILGNTLKSYRVV